MKTLTKLALISAMAMSSSAFAMESLDDSALSQTTGQDGITIKLDAQSDGTIFGADNIVVHDTDGVGANYGVTASTAGAIVLGKGASGANAFSIKGAAGDAVTIKVDADSNAGAPVLNVNIGLPTSLTVNTGDIYVATSGGIAAASGAQFTNATKILDNISIGLGGATMNVQLGNAPQGAMIKLGGNVAGGITISNLALNDTSANGGGSIRIGTISLRDAGGANLALGTSINAKTGGLSIVRDSTLPNGGNIDVRLSDVKLGTAASSSLGNIAVLNMAVPNMTITGH